MVNYQKGKIYKIVCNKSNLVYYGSTTKEYLTQRLVQHRTHYKMFLDGKCRFMTSYRILENNDFDIILVELYPCNSKDELQKRERYYIENNICVNKNIPTRTKTEYKEDYNFKNKEKIALSKKIYNQINKERINAKNRSNYSDEKREKNILKLKNYRELNKDLVNKKSREIYKRKKENKLMLDWLQNFNIYYN